MTHMWRENIPGELLERAGPPIQYRLRLELFGQPRSDPVMLALQSRILEDPAVKEVSGWQAPDGWLAWNFHSYHSMETGIRLLCEKGLDPQHPVLSKALLALRSCSPDRLDRGLGKPGRILDQLGLGGAQMIRAVVLAYAGVEDEPGVQEQIAVALAGFRSVLGIDCIEDLIDDYKGKPVLRQGLLWPGIYHLRLLAWTRGWRTPHNLSLMAECIQKLVRLSPIPALNARYKAQLVAPASFCMDHFDPDLSALDGAGWMIWFQRMELLARLGVIHRVPELERQAEELAEMLETGGGLFTRPLSHAYFRKWGAYTGLMLESDWKEPRRRSYDLTFRCILLLHYNKSETRSKVVTYPE